LIKQKLSNKLVTSATHITRAIRKWHKVGSLFVNIIAGVTIHSEEDAVDEAVVEYFPLPTTPSTYCLRY